MISRSVFNPFLRRLFTNVPPSLPVFTTLHSLQLVIHCVLRYAICLVCYVLHGVAFAVLSLLDFPACSLLPSRHVLYPALHCISSRPQRMQGLSYATYSEEPSQSCPRCGGQSTAHATHEQQGTPAEQQHAASPSARTKYPPSDKTNRVTSGFSSGTHGQRPPAVCAVCLGRNNHSFIECSANRIWDNSVPTVSKRVHLQLLTRSTDKPLCINWQQGTSCSMHSHDEHHLCSSCLSHSHGAQYCARTQASAPSMPL